MTAIEWLLKNIISEPLAEEHFEHNKECWDKAEEMEKQQIIDANNRGWKVAREGIFEPAEQYYNETYKNTNE